MLRGVWQKLNEEVVQQAILRVIGGETVLAVAGSIGVDDMTLTKHMKRRGFRVPGRYGRATIVMPTDPVTLAYIAGLFDGEGHVGYVRANNKRTGAIYQYWAAGVTNTDRGLMEWLAKTCGVKMTIRSPRRCPRNKDKVAKTSYVIQPSAAANIAAFLEPLIPHMRIREKRLRAEKCVVEIRGKLSGEYAYQRRSAQPARSFASPVQA